MYNYILQVHLISDTVRLLSAWLTFFNMISLLLGHFLLFFPCSSPDSLPDDISCIKADVVVRLTIKALNPVVVLKSCILSKQTTKIYHCWILLRQTFRPEEGLPANTHTHTLLALHLELSRRRTVCLLAPTAPARLRNPTFVPSNRQAAAQQWGQRGKQHLCTSQWRAIPGWS